MADTLADVLPLFTRVNTALAKRLEKVESTVYNVKKAQTAKKDRVIEESEPVEIESFGTKALAELNKVFKVNAAQTKETKETKTAGSSMDWLKSFSLAGLIGVAALIKKFIDSGFFQTFGLFIRNFPDLITGFFKKFNGSVNTLFLGLPKKITDGIKDGMKKSLGKETETAAEKAATNLAESKLGKGAVKAGQKVGQNLLKTTEQAGEKATTKQFEEYLASKQYAIKPGSEKRLIDLRTGNQLERSNSKFIYEREQKLFQEQLGKASTKTEGGVLSKIGGAAYNISSRVGEFVGNLGVKAFGKIPGNKQIASMVERYGPTILKFLGKLKPGVGFLLKVLRVPGVIDAIFAGANINSLINKYQSGKIDEETFKTEVARAGTRAVGSALGQVLGGIGGGLAGGSLGAAAAGASLGFLAPIAPALAWGGKEGGQFLGSLIGDLAGSGLITLLEKGMGIGQNDFGRATGLSRVGDAAKNARDTLFNTIFGSYTSLTGVAKLGLGHSLSGEKYLNELTAENAAKKKEMVNVKDVTISAGGKVIVPHSSDTLYAMKQGGPMDNFFNKNLEANEEGNKILKFHSDKSLNIMSNQVKLIQTTNNLLQEVLQKINTPTNIINSPKITTSNYGNLGSLRALQGVAY